MGVAVIPLTAQQARALHTAVSTSGDPGLYNAHASWQHMAMYVLWGRAR